MARVSTLLFLLILVSSRVSAQQPSNAGFEYWEYEPDFPHLPVGPSGWQCNDRGVNSGVRERPVNTFAIAHSGNYAALLFTVIDTASGLPTMGTLTQHIALHGSRPDYLTLYTLMTDSYPDPPHIQLAVTAGHNRVIGEAFYRFTHANGEQYVRVDVPITYTGTGIPDSLKLTIRSASGTGGETINNVIGIDDISLHMAEQDFEVGELYPNPANTDQYLVLHNPGEQAFSIDLLNMEGQYLWQASYEASGVYESLQFDCSLLPDGVYTYLIRSGGTLVSKKFVVNHG